jgi:hypothetical protein
MTTPITARVEFSTRVNVSGETTARLSLCALRALARDALFWALGSTFDGGESAKKVANASDTALQPSKDSFLSMFENAGPAVFAEWRKPSSESNSQFDSDA